MTEACWKKNFRSLLGLWLRIFLNLIRTDWSGALLRSPLTGVQRSGRLHRVTWNRGTKNSAQFNACACVCVCETATLLFCKEAAFFCQAFHQSLGWKTGMRRGSERKGRNLVLQLSVLLTKRLINPHQCKWTSLAGLRQLVLAARSCLQLVSGTKKVLKSGGRSIWRKWSLQTDKKSLLLPRRGAWMWLSSLQVLISKNVEVEFSA